MMPKPSTCHPDKHAKSRGLCQRCYRNEPDIRAKRLARARQYYRENKELILKRTSARQSANPDLNRTYRRRYREKYPERARVQHLRRTYGLTPDQFNDMKREQGGRCAVVPCPNYVEGREVKLCVDHCHRTGAIRGLLCRECNLGVGQLGDTLESLESVVLYLKGAGRGKDTI